MKLQQQKAFFFRTLKAGQEFDLIVLRLNVVCWEKKTSWVALQVLDGIIEFYIFQQRFMSVISWEIKE